MNSNKDFWFKLAACLLMISGILFSLLVILGKCYNILYYFNLSYDIWNIVAIIALAVNLISVFVQKVKLVVLSFISFAILSLIGAPCLSIAIFLRILLIFQTTLGYLIWSKLKWLEIINKGPRDI
ncbi:hypothetical protein [Limihaloglobus sulfuriphilus]|uniref:hypothetical protein n=1 Tax=Limihaloglobus sulfuriphilus TaxID=1851148 RepID=UPI0011BACD50|nr:hypothetical protein [Limihaloglobus sulfuriphilus]